MIDIPLRGELTHSPKSIFTAPDSPEKSLDHVMVQLLRFSDQKQSQLAHSLEETVPVEASRNSTAPWALTKAESMAAQSVLIPFLVHLAVAKDDLEGLERSLSSAPSGSYNLDCLDCGSGRSPLQVAALNGSIRCTNYLLQRGALVHLRDISDHTALYYVSEAAFR